MKTLSRLQGYMGRRKALLPLAVGLSALGGLAGFAPFVFIWLIVKELLTGGSPGASPHITAYALWAAGTAVGGVVLYFGALMCSHLAAFRVESNIRKSAMRRIVNMPLGFFDTNTQAKCSLFDVIYWFIIFFPLWM